MIMKEHEYLFITDYLEKENLQSIDLYNDLLDHMCCDVEAIMDKEQCTFSIAFNKSLESVCPDGAHDIEEELIYLLTIKRKIMLHKIVFTLGFLGGFTILFSFAMEIAGIIYPDLSRLLIMCGIMIISISVYPYLVLRWYQKTKPGKLA